MTTANKKLVDNEKGHLDRRIFIDDDIYQQELEQVFGRCWLFLGHESQISKPNDFVAARMAEDPILLTRDAKGKIHAFLNMCRHRGNRVCRSDFGNSPSFMCTYHGWTFATDGKLVGVPGYKEAYFEELDRSQWGLVEARAASYKGLVFATWDQTAPTLVDYLSDMAWYLDLSLDNSAGGSEVLKGVQKGVVPCNWKFPCDNNGGDGYHSPTTHHSSEMTEALYGSRSTPASVQFSRGKGRTIHAGNGHCMVGIGPGFGGPVDRKPTDQIPKDPIERYRTQLMPEAIKRLGEFRVRNGGVRTGTCTIFPNFSYSSTSIRILHPQGPRHIEEWSWVLVDKDAPEEVKTRMRKLHTLRHGPSGIREEEDLNNWLDCTRTSSSFAARTYPQNLQLGLGHEDRDERFPGFASPGPNEVNQRFFYSRWAEMMNAPSWAQIKIDPRTTA